MAGLWVVVVVIINWVWIKERKWFWDFKEHGQGIRYKFFHSIQKWKDPTVNGFPKGMIPTRVYIDPYIRLLRSQKTLKNKRKRRRIFTPAAAMKAEDWALSCSSLMLLDRRTGFGWRDEESQRDWSLPFDDWRCNGELGWEKRWGEEVWKVSKKTIEKRRQVLQQFNHFDWWSEDKLQWRHEWVHCDLIEN